MLDVCSDAAVYLGHFYVFAAEQLQTNVKSLREKAFGLFELALKTLIDRKIVVGGRRPGIVLADTLETLKKTQSQTGQTARETDVGIPYRDNGLTAGHSCTKPRRFGPTPSRSHRELPWGRFTCQVFIVRREFFSHGAIPPPY